MAFTPRDVKDISALVAKKLELYMNHERREERFDPQGRYRTTPKMQTLDMMYHMLDTADLHKKEGGSSRSGSPHKDHKSKKSKKRMKSEHKDESSTDARNGCEEERSTRAKHKGKREKRQMITPCLVHNSRRVVPVGEAERLTQAANKIFAEQDLDKLHVIHRYRPHSPDVAPLTENGKVANYTLHVGSALHSKNYVDYYLKEGLQSSKRDYAKRLQRLQSKKEGETDQDRKGCSETSSTAGQNHKSTSLRMQEILSPHQSMESLTSSRSSTPRKLDPLTRDKPIYNTFTKHQSQSSRGSSEKLPKASSHLYKAKRYASGYGYRIIADDGTNVESTKDKKMGRESRADIASSEEYSKFSASASQTGRQESGREGFSSEVEERKVIELTDVEMEYKKYKNSVDSAVSIQERESMDSRAESNNESYTSATHTSVRSTTSQYSRQSRELDRSYQSNHSLISGPSGMYHTGTDMYNTTQSEQDIDTARSISILSSTPRRRSRVKQEPIQTIINAPVVPPLGIPSDANETNGPASSMNSTAIEDYLTAEEKALRHPDARALDEGKNSSQIRARDHTFKNDDSRAERSVQKYLGSDEIPAEAVVECSLPPIAHDTNEFEKQERVREKKTHEEIKTEDERSCKRENDLEKSDAMKDVESTHETSITYSDVVIDCKEVDSKGKHTRARRRAKELEGTETERGEDELKNMELHRGDVPDIEKNKMKIKPERGDDTPRTMACQGRLTKSAKRRGVSNYFTMGEDERGLEKEYFEPLNENDREEYIPAIETENGSELNTPASSRPSSACSDSSDGTSLSAHGERREKAKSATGNKVTPDEKESNRPQSAATRSTDGRGDDSNSVKVRSIQKSKSEEKEAAALNDDKGTGNGDVSQSVCSHVSYGEDAQNYKMQTSFGSRGSITTKERLGTGRGYSIDGEMLDRGLDENSGGKATGFVTAKSEKEKGSNQSQSEVKESSVNKRSVCGEQLVSQDVKKEEDDQKGPFEESKPMYETKKDYDSIEDVQQAEVKESICKDVKVVNQSQKEDLIVETSDAVKNKADESIKKNTSSRSIEQKDEHIDKCKEEVFKSGQEMNSDVTKTQADQNLKNISTGNLDKTDEQAETNEEDGVKPVAEVPPERQLSKENVTQEVPKEEKAFIEADSVEHEVIKGAASGSASLLISDADTVIDFRPLSASTAISVSNDHDFENKRLSLPQPSKIVEVTEIESNMGSGRTSRLAKDPVVPHPAERKQSKDRDPKYHVVNIADVKLESYEHIKQHPAMKRSSSDYLSSRIKEKSDLNSQRNLSLPQEKILENAEFNADDVIEKVPAEQKKFEEKIESVTIGLGETSGSQKEHVAERQETVQDPSSTEKAQGTDKHSTEPEKMQQKSSKEREDMIEKSTPDPDKSQIKSQIERINVMNTSEQFTAVQKFDPEKVKVTEEIHSQERTMQQQTDLEPGKQTTTVAENDSRVEGKVKDKSPSEQELKLVTVQLVEKTQNGQEKLSSMAMKVSEQNQTGEGNKKEIPTKPAPSEHEKCTEQSLSRQDKTSKQSLSEQGKVTEQPISDLSDKEKLDEQSALKQEESKGPMLQQEDKTREPSSNGQENRTEQLSPEHEKMIDQSPCMQDKLPESPLPQQEKFTGQPPSEQKNLLETLPFEQKKLAEQASFEHKKLKEQPRSETEEKAKPIPSQQDELTEQHPIEQENPIVQSPFEHEKLARQNLAGEEEVSKQPPSQPKKLTGQPPSAQENSTQQPSSEGEKPKVKFSSEVENPIEQLQSEQEKLTEQPPSKQEKLTEQPPAMQDKHIEQHLSEQEKLSGQLQPEQEKVTEPSPPVQEKVTEPSSPVQEKVAQPSPPEQEKVTEPSPPVQEKVTEPSPPVQEKVTQPSPPVQEKVTEPSVPVQEKVTEPSVPVQEKVTEPSVPVQEKVTEPSVPVQEKVTQPSPPVQEKVTEPFPSEQEKVTQPSVPVQEKVTEPSVPVQEKVTQPSPPVQEKVTEPFPSEQEKVTQLSVTVQEKVTEPSVPVQEKVTEPSVPVQEKVTQPSPPVQEKVTEPFPSEQEKVTQPSVPVQEKVTEPSVPVQEKVTEPSVPVQEKVTEPSVPVQEKVTQPSPPVQEKVTEPSPPVKEKMTDQPAFDQEKMAGHPPPKEPTLFEQKRVREEEQEKQFGNDILKQEKPVNEPETLTSDQERQSEKPPSQQEKSIEQSAKEKEALREQPQPMLEKVTENSLSNEINMREELPSGDKVQTKQQPLTDQEQNSHVQEKENPSRSNENISEPILSETDQGTVQPAPKTRDGVENGPNDDSELLKAESSAIVNMVLEKAISEAKGKSGQPSSEAVRLVETTASENVVVNEPTESKEANGAQFACEQEKGSKQPQFDTANVFEQPTGVDQTPF